MVSWKAFLIPLVLAVGVAPAAHAAEAASSDVPQKVPVLDLTAIDKSADPCVDFYQYACGGWMSANPIPGDRPTWGRFDQLYQNNRLVLRDILEKAAAERPGRDAIEQKIGDYYATCMDEKAIEARGLAPLKPELDRIAALKSKDGLAAEVAHLHSLGVGALLAFGAEPDFKNASRMIAATDQGGMGLPSREYYFNDDPKSAEIRQKYVAYIQSVFQLLGDAPAKAAAEAQTVMRIETALSKGAHTPVEQREPTNVYHLMKIDQLRGLAPSFGWQEYFREMKAPDFSEINVRAPEFLKQVDAELRSVPLAGWQTYLRFWLVNNLADALPSAFEKANFDFYDRTLQGVEEMPPRWRRCVRRADRHLGEALGRKYVEAAFGEQARERTDQMVSRLFKALGEDIRGLDWMSPATKQQAEVKLSKIGRKIGYPETWRDYSSLAVTRGDALGNWERAEAFEFRRQLGKIGAPLDRSEWLISPPTVNAYYHPSMNNINFPAGILQPPFFDAKADDALNYGAIGAVIGHELTHGFDDEGSKFDALGNLREWWTPEDRRKFDERTACVADQYSGYTAIDDVKVNGKLTLGENTADHGGLRIAYRALHDAINALGDKPAPARDGLTPDQRFFLSFGQVWCESNRPEFERQMAFVNPHSPGRYRTNGVVSDMPEFQQAFGCKAGQPMVRENACRVW